MPAGPVIAVLANIPWGQVVDAAPKVAEGARRLWEAARAFRKSRPLEMPAASASAPLTEAEQMTARLSELEGTVQELREQMQASAEVVKDLANQNVLLVQRIEVARRRLARLAMGGTACFLMLSVATLWLWATR